MKNYSAALLSFFLFVLPMGLLAQELADYAPKTPETMAMDKFVDIPPGSYTGVAGYSIPLYDITVDGYSIPISLNYHGMGIKVNEVASSVGLGWSLSIGGISLSREVVGVNDNDINQLNMNVTSFSPIIGTSADYNTARILDTELMELQPDYYSYSLLNNSGKFILDYIGNGQTIPKDDVQIIGATLLKDNQGIEYHFLEQHENFSITGNSPSSSISENSIPSYRINKIIFPSGKTIDFEYINSVHNYITNHSETKSIIYNNANLMDTNIVDGRCSVEQNSTSRTAYSMTEKIISKITYNNAEVNFIYDTQERQDIGGKKLKNVTVKSRIDNITKSIRDYNLTTSYWQSSSIPSTDIYINPTNEFYNGLIYRLRLDGIEETLSEKSYTFDYYDTHNLPYRLSKDTDFWGLYNGKNNPSYIHQFTYYDTDNYLRVNEGADKDPVLDYARTATLKTIHLPTGGTHEFEYELDDYKFDDTENQFFKREHTISVNQSTIFNQQIPLNIDGQDYKDGFGYALEFYWKNNVLAEGNLPISGDTYYGVQLSYGNVIDVQTLYQNIKVDLPPLSQNNTYSLNFRGNPSSVPENVEAKLTWYQNNTQNVRNKKAGNLRVKSITLKDSDGTTALKRNYTYNHPTDTTFSSGVFREFPKSYITEYPPDDSGYFCRYINYVNNYDVNTSTFKGKSVVYEYVEEEYINTDNTSENYYTKKQFSLPIIQGSLYPNALPKTPFVDNSFTGGLLLNSQAFNSNDEKVSETTNLYEFDNHFNNKSYNNYSFGGVGSNAVSGGIVISLKSAWPADLRYNWNVFFYTSTWVKLLESTTKTYFDNATSSIESKTTYQYDDSDQAYYRHIKPISQTTHDSLGEEVKTVYEYPQELLNEPHTSDLVDANRIANPLITSNYKNIIGVYQLIGKQKSIYEDWGNGILEPEKIQTLKGELSATNIFEDRIVFEDYDDYGNPLEVSKADGTHIIYIWGYNNTQPIAKIENASYIGMLAPLISVINDAKIASNNDNDNCRSINCKEQLLRDALDNLRNHPDLADAMVTTYTYDPLVGVTSTTDPRGYTVYYEYDDFNRLKQVKDKDGNILSKNDYNYKTQY